MRSQPTRFVPALVLLASALALSATILLPGKALASEHVLDGGFDAVTACGGGDCTSPVWSESTGGSAFTGPLCAVGEGSCGFFEGPMAVGPYSGTKWAQLGGETTMSLLNTYSIQQVVSMPAGPATLSFRLRTRDSNASTGSFTAKIGGTPVYAVGGSNSPYTTVIVDASAFAGGLRTLAFEARNSNNNGSTDSFNLDDVSIQDTAAQPTAAAQPTCKGEQATVAGTPGSDEIIGTPGRDVVAALEGNDKVSGLAGKDLICGGDGRDTLRGGKGKDRLFGEAGKDRLVGGKGKDRCVGGKGRDADSGCEAGS